MSKVVKVAKDMTIWKIKRARLDSTFPVSDIQQLIRSQSDSGLYLSEFLPSTTFYEKASTWFSSSGFLVSLPYPSL